MKVDFKNGVSPQIVETMLGEVMDAMVFHGEFKNVEQGNCIFASEAINAISHAVTDILNRELKKQAAQLAKAA